EYFPDSIASRDTSVSMEITQVLPNANRKDMYEKGLKRYVEEAQSLSRFYQLQGIVSVKDFFYENGTAYIVMEYINGINLKEYLNNAGGRLDEATVLTLMKPVLESLWQIHNSGMVHRDISPDNIMVDKNNQIKLIDFGSARGQSAETDKTYTVILKHGYAPSEQYYAKGNQGPWTDIYSLCATMYKMLTGQIPPNSVERMEKDEYVAPSAWGISVSPRTEAVLAKGLAVKAADRYQNIGQLLGDLYGAAPMEQIVSPNRVAPIAPAAPVNMAASYANPISQQSMHLDMQPAASSVPAEAKARNKKAIIICAAIFAVLVLAVVIFFVTRKDKDDDDKETTTENTTTTEDTEEPGIPGDTEEPDEPVEPSSGDYEYEWPEELSDNWRDYTISIDGTIYKLPIPYSEFETQGWKSNYIANYVPGGGIEYGLFERDGLECYVYIYNFGFNEVAIDDCFVVALEFDSDYYNVEGHEIILANDITMFESTLDDIKLAYGAPDYFYEYDAYASVDYAGDEYEDGMDFELDSEGKLRCVRIANTAIPEGYEVSASDISSDPPAINAQYVAPSGPSTDRFDSIITLDGVDYQLPVTATELMANGWVFDTASDEYITGYSSTWTYMEKDGERIEVTVENYTSDAILTHYGYISTIGIDVDYFNKDITFPGGMSLDSMGSDFKDLYGDQGDSYYESEYTSFTSYAVWYYSDDAYIYVSAYSDPETGKITEYSYECSVYENKYFD
ncbi:MAG: serine/threonine protein kinase, partial [Lachnospiraceae bacterium]|nr:serine/threonine protein kinase [Lachnospiraceae bacterium]